MSILWVKVVDRIIFAASLMVYVVVRVSLPGEYSHEPCKCVLQSLQHTIYCKLHKIQLQKKHVLCLRWLWWLLLGFFFLRGGNVIRMSVIGTLCTCKSVRAGPKLWLKPFMSSSRWVFRGEPQLFSPIFHEREQKLTELSCLFLSSAHMAGYVSEVESVMIKSEMSRKVQLLIKMQLSFD